MLAVKALIDEGFQQLELNRVQARVATDNHRSRLVVRRLSFEMVCEHVGSVALDSHPESFQFEPNGDRVYVNVPKQFGIAVVDRQKRAVVAKWGLGVQFENYPMALDDAHKRLFVGCRLPAKLVVLDTTSGRIVANFPTIGDTDDIFYDGGRQVVYVIGGEGAVEVFRQRDPDHYEPERRRNIPMSIHDDLLGGIDHGLRNALESKCLAG